MAETTETEVEAGIETDDSGQIESMEAASSQRLNTARLIVGTIALQAGTKMVTAMIDRMVLGVPAETDDSAVPNPAPHAKPGKIRKFTAGKLATVATKSKPGAIAVAGGLFAKHLFDRGGKRLKAKREARRQSS